MDRMIPPAPIFITAQNCYLRFYREIPEVPLLCPHAAKLPFLRIPDAKDGAGGESSATLKMNLFSSLRGETSRDSGCADSASECANHPEY